MSKWGKAKAWTVQEVLLLIKVFHYKKSRWPTTDDFNNDEDLPSRATVARLFGTLAEARRQAGARHGGHEGHGGSGRGGGWTPGKARNGLADPAQQG